MPVFPASHETRETTCATDAAEAITTPATGVNVSTEARVVTMEVGIEPKAMPYLISPSPPPPYSHRRSTASFHCRCAWSPPLPERHPRERDRRPRRIRGDHRPNP